MKGYGFIACEAFPDQDVFVLKSELPQGRWPGLPRFGVEGLVFLGIRLESKSKSVVFFFGFRSFFVVKHQKGDPEKQLKNTIDFCRFVYCCLGIRLFVFLFFLHGVFLVHKIASNRVGHPFSLTQIYIGPCVVE